jgi:hypothetical protein
MGGFVIDIVLMFLFKSAARLSHLLQSSKWERGTASVVERVVVAPVMGCPSVKVHYKVLPNDHSTEGWDEIPFLFRSSASQFAEKFAENIPVRIRVNPNKRGETRLFEIDQK